MTGLGFELPGAIVYKNVWTFLLLCVCTSERDLNVCYLLFESVQVGVGPLPPPFSRPAVKVSCFGRNVMERLQLLCFCRFFSHGSTGKTGSSSGPSVNHHTGHKVE